MYRLINIVEDLGKDLTIGAGVGATFFAQFDGYSTRLLNITDFNLDLVSALSVWESLIRTAIGILTIIGLYYRIKYFKKKHE